MNLSKPSQAALFKPESSFGLRLRVAREVNYSFENDRKKLKTEMHETRKKLRADYWRMQTQIENKAIEDFQAEKRKKQRDDMDRWRSSICTIAKNTKDKIAYLESKEKKTLEQMRMQDIRNMRKTVSNKLML